MSFMNFAQATAIPDSGASNAADFQPPTRNPQSAPGSLQQGTGPQPTTSSDVLNNPNLRLSVPVNSSPPADSSSPEVASPGINWPLVIIMTVVLVVIAEAILRRREKRQAAIADSNNQTNSVPTAQSSTRKKLKNKSNKSRSKRKRR